MRRDGGFLVLVLLPALLGVSSSLGLSGALVATRRAVASELRRLEGEAAFFVEAAKAMKAIAASASPEADSVFDAFWKAFPSLALRDLSGLCLESQRLSAADPAAADPDATEPAGSPSAAFSRPPPVNATLAPRSDLAEAARHSGMSAAAAERFASAILAARAARELFPRDIEGLARAASGDPPPSRLPRHVGAKSWRWEFSASVGGSRLAVVYHGEPAGDLSRIASYELMEFRVGDNR